MRKLSISALIAGGLLAFAAPAHAAPLSAGGALAADQTRAAINETLGTNVTDVQYRQRHRNWRHNRWHRGPRYVAPRYGYRHWAPRAPRYYVPPPRNYYGYAPRPYRYY